MSRTYAHRPFHVVELQEYGIPVCHGPRVDPANPWVYTPGMTERGMPWWRMWEYYSRNSADSAAVRDQRRAMRRKRRVEDHLLTRDPLRYDDMTTTTEKIDKWALPSW